MTKLKNTKKGMAKKALSISLVAAMLATSNVPVWAAEDIFSDGSAVQAEVVEDFSDAEAFSSEAPAEDAAPAMDAVEEDGTQDIMTASEGDTNLMGYTSDAAIVMNDAGWENDFTVSGSIKDRNGADVDVSYVWLADGKEADDDTTASGHVDTLKGETLGDVKYVPTKDDFNKTLSLMIYVKQGNTTVFQQTITGGVIGAKDISTSLTATPSFGAVSYNGKEQKMVPTNAASFTAVVDGVTISPDQISWNYSQEAGDFTNVTDADITVTGSLEGTYDRTSTAYGYKATTKSGTYKIAPLNITGGNFEASLKTTSVQYTGSNQKFGKSDLTIQVKVNDTTKVDITEALDDDAEYTGINKAVGTGYTITGISTANLLTKDEAEIMKNFKVPTPAVTVATSNSYAITVRNLSECTGKLTKEYTLDTFTAADVLPGNIQLTGKDGKTFTLADMAGDVTISVEQSVLDAVKNGTAGTIANGVTIRYKADTQNVTGSISLPITLTTRSLSTANATVKLNSVDKTLTGSSANNITFELPYIGAAYDLQAEKYGLTDFAIAGVMKQEYKLTYSDNVNAGVVKVTITGTENGSFAGSTQTVYFKINPAIVASRSVTMKDKVTVNPANNNNAALYKDALDLKIQQELFAGNGKTTLELDKDYSVKYYYAKSAGLSSEEDIKSSTYAGDNIAGDYVYAVVTVKKGNYNKDTFIKSAQIQKKSIENITVSVEKDSYTYTGKEIVPNVTVKDGTTTLEKGVDYSVKVKDNVNVGTATITIVPTATSNYDVNTTAAATFKITEANAETVTVTLKATASAVAIAGKTNTFDYTGKQVKPDVATVKLNGVDVTNQFAIAYVTYGENVNAGKEMGSVVIAPKDGNKNFSGTKTHLFNIQGKELTGTLKIYGDDKRKIDVGADKVAHKYFFYNGDECKFADADFTAANLLSVKEASCIIQV